MGKHIGNESIERVSSALGFDFYDVGADITYEAADIVARRSSPDGFTKENALNCAADLYVSSLTHANRLAMDSLRRM